MDPLERQGDENKMTNVTQRRIIFLYVLLFAVSLGITGLFVKLFEGKHLDERHHAVRTIGNNMAY